MRATTPRTHRLTPRKAKSPLWAKFLVGVGVIMLAAATSAFAYASVLYDKVDGIQQEDILGNTTGDPNVEGPLNLLMIGADLRADSDEPARADTIMILHIDEKLRDADVVSIPRDLKVDIDDCGEYKNSPCSDKINAAYTFGGPTPKGGAKNLANTVTDLTGIEFDGVALVNFEGFLEVVETFGGIELCLEQDLDATHGGYYEEGCNRYKPDDALAIVRERYAWGSDYGRQRMQQHFIKQLLKEADAQGYVKKPTKIPGLIDQVGDKMILDLGGTKPVDFAFELRGVDAGNIDMIQLPSESVETDDGQSYVDITEGQLQEDAQALFEAFQNDTLDTWTKEHPDYMNEDPKDE